MPFQTTSNLTPSELALAKLLSIDVRFKLQSPATGAWLVGQISFLGDGRTQFTYFGDQNGAGTVNNGTFRVTDADSSKKFVKGILTFTGLHAGTHYINGDPNAGEQFPLDLNFLGGVDGTMTLISTATGSKAMGAKGETEPFPIW